MKSHFSQIEIAFCNDEVQRGGTDLLLAVKSVVDKDKTPGQFFLTGSANVLANRKALDALTGRVESITLWPLAQSEIERASDNFADTGLMLHLLGADEERLASDVQITGKALDAFRCGVLLYTGGSTVRLSDRIFAVPISGLWE